MAAPCRVETDRRGRSLRAPTAVASSVNVPQTAVSPQLRGRRKTFGGGLLAFGRRGAERRQPHGGSQDQRHQQIEAIVERTDP